MTDKTDDKKYTVEIAPGAFDNFDGTQEELDNFIAEITAMAETGELFQESEPLDLEALFEEDPEMAIDLAGKLGLFDDLVDEDGNEISFDEIKELASEERKRKLN